MTSNCKCYEWRFRRSSISILCNKDQGGWMMISCLCVKTRYYFLLFRIFKLFRAVEWMKSFLLGQLVKILVLKYARGKKPYFNKSTRCVKSSKNMLQNGSIGSEIILTDSLLTFEIFNDDLSRSDSSFCYFLVEYLTRGSNFEIVSPRSRMWKNTS